MAETLVLNIAVVGCGPAGFYTAEALTKQFGAEVQVDITTACPPRID